jgi:hypothetical protein
MSAKRVIYTGIRYLNAGDTEVVSLTDGLSLVRPNEMLIAEDDRPMMTELQFSEARNASRFLLLRYDLPIEFVERERAVEAAETLFRSALTAFQVIKPVETLGLIYRGEDLGTSFLIEQVEYRHPMAAGEWARLKRFDKAMFPDLMRMIERVRRVLEGTSAELKNAVTLLQLGMENYHPLIAGMLWVMGMEAILESGNRNEFRDKLVALLGANTPVFPVWDSSVPALPWIVKDIAIDLYMLRNKLVHGVDLRKAATDKSSPVDLLRLVKLHPDSQDTQYSLLLSQAACFLLCQVIQKTI